MRLKPSKVISFLILSAVAVLSLALAQGKPVLPDTVHKIFQKNCTVAGCHQGQYPAMNLSLEPEKVSLTAINAISQQLPQLKIIETAAPEKSYLLMKIRGAQDIAGQRMPLNADPLPPTDIKAVESWVLSLKNIPPDKEQKKNFKKPAFWGTRLINLPTTQTIDKGRFLFRLSHRFEPSLKSGYDTYFGLDGPAYDLIGIGYGISNRLGITLGRTNRYQEVELGLYGLAFKQGGSAGLPFSLAVFLGSNLVTESQPDRKLFDGENFRFHFQVSLSRQISDRLSFQLVPGFTSNANHLDSRSRGTFALGLGARFMLFGDLSLIGEWVPVLAGHKDNAPGWGFGLELKTGGHVFQMFVLNSTGMTPAQYLPGGDLKDNLRLGFNIFRTF